MRRQSFSLQRRLLLTLVVWVLGIGGIATVVIYYLSYQDARNFQDADLVQVAAWVDPQALPSHPLSAPWFLREKKRLPREEDYGSMVVEVMTPGKIAQPLAIPEDWQPGFHQFHDAGQDWRVFVRRLADGRRLAVAQPYSLVREAAGDGLQRTLWPFLALLPILLLAIAWQLHRGFLPLRRLAKEIHALQPQQEMRLPERAVPQEIQPFWVAIQELLQRVEILLQRERRFVADAAHELRTPLAALSLQVENARAAQDLGVCQERLAQVESGLGRSRRLLDQLLTLERQVASAAQVRCIDMGELLREILAERVPVAEAREMEMILELTGPLRILGDLLAYRVLISNALDNALRYAPAGTSVWLRWRLENASVVVEIEDEGPGIPAEQREAVFAPFHRGSLQGGEGSGLGLAIIAAAAQRLGGQLALRDGRSGPGLRLQYRQPAPELC